MKKFYSVCQQKICIESPFFSDENPDWKLFEIAPTDADVSIRCHIVEALPPSYSAERELGNGTFVSLGNGGACRRVDMAVHPGVKTFYNHLEGDSAQAYFTEESLPIMMDSRYMWNSVAAAQLLLPRGALFMHASYIEHEGKAILFSGRCGIGKSTQAALWEKHRSARIINGDKAGVLVTDEEIFACGLPFCGTSRICNNVTMPLGAIVLLEQGESNKARRVTGAQALVDVLNNIYLDFALPNEHQMCVDLLFRVFEKVPVFRLNCTPDERAVSALEEALGKEAV
ncbi:MAG: hypothetical protein IJC13_07795 [Clostridia bacterium]|nr:hypothetical protein [Clostridia bacterium]